MPEIQYLRNQLGVDVNISLAVYLLRNIILTRGRLQIACTPKRHKNRS